MFGKEEKLLALSKLQKTSYSRPRTEEELGWQTFGRAAGENLWKEITAKYRHGCLCDKCLSHYLRALEQ
jgi:hypothetical protein